MATFAFGGVSCVREPRPRLELDGELLGAGADDVAKSLNEAILSLELFARPGPLEARLLENRSITLNGHEALVFDEAVPGSATPSPLVILVHGNRSHKEAHRRQITHLSTYGLHALAIQLPNTDRWLANGDKIRSLVTKIQATPKALTGNVDTNRIILAGHSFGGSAITLAAASLRAKASGPKKRSGVVGLVFLDPAVFSPAVEAAMRLVDVPTLLLGSDPTVYRARKRGLFFKNIRGPMTELTIAGATHDDAQNPSMFAVTTMGLDPFTSAKRQRLFTAALTAGAFSLATTGSMDHAWTALARAEKVGQLRDLKRRLALQPRAKGSP